VHAGFQMDVLAGPAVEDPMESVAPQEDLIRSSRSVRVLYMVQIKPLQLILVNYGCCGEIHESCPQSIRS
jgi:hypothetical protein